MNKKGTLVANRFLEKEKLLKQFDKKTVSLEANNPETDITVKTFEYAIKGSRGPNVILINGAGGPIEGWMKIWPLVDDRVTLFAYNRLGIDKSSDPIEPQNGLQMVRDLRQLLSTVGLHPPYILVGHSLGGFIAHLFAATYPNDILSVLFLEASTVDDVTPAKMFPKKSKGNPNNEVNHVGETVGQIRGLSIFPQVPVAVIAGFHPMSRMLLPRGGFIKRFENQKKLLELSIQNSLIVAAKSGHFPQMNEPRLVIDAIYKSASL